MLLATQEEISVKESRYRQRLYTAMLVTGVYVLLPFVLLCLYNQPAADDYYSAVRDAQTGLGTVLQDTYTHWSGRYFAVLVSRINPLLYHSLALYRLMAFLLMVMFIAFLFVLIRQAAGKYVNSKEALVLTAIVTIIYFTAMPSMAEGFYWFSGAWVYQLANVLTMLFIALLLDIGRTGYKLYVLLACVLAVCVAGCNEISLLVICFCTVAFTVKQYKAKSRFLSSYLLITIVCLTASSIAAFAPGNFERLNNQQEYSVSFIWTLAGGAGITGVYVVQWLVQLLMASLLYIPLLGWPMAKRMATDGAIVSVNLNKSIGWFIAAFIGMQLFTVYVAGGSNIGRIENVLYLYFIAGYFYLLQVYLVQRALAKDNTLTNFPVYYKLAAVLFFINLLDINNNVSSAWLDVLPGRAAKYSNELNHRAEIAAASNTDTTLVAPLTTLPKTLFFTDIKCTSDSIDLWMNKAYSAYYGKSYILISAPLPPAQSNMEVLKNIGREIRENVFKK